MMRRLLCTVCWGLALSLAGGCEPLADKYQDGQLLFLRSNGADMPIWIRGKRDSDTFLIYLHGGPGGSALAGFASAPPLLALRDEYGLVFWDQRASGVSQGNPSRDSLNLDAFIQDTDKVIELVRSLYHPSKLVLMGHSWGGLLGTAYLIEPERQAKLVGWIEVDGAHNLALQYTLSREWMLTRTKALLETENDKADWNQALRFYERTETLTPDTAATHYRYCEAAGAYWFDPRNEPDVTAADVFGSPLSLGVAVNLTNTSEAIGLTYRSAFDLSPRMAQIRIPALILWGAEDGVIPAPLADDAYTSLGTADDAKRKVVFKQAAHSPMFEAPVAFEFEVREFLERVRRDPP